MVCLSVCLMVFLSVCQSVCLGVCQSVCRHGRICARPLVWVSNRHLACHRASYRLACHLLSSGRPRGFQSVRSPEGLPFQPPPLGRSPLGLSSRLSSLLSSGRPRGFQSVRSPEGLPFQPPSLGLSSLLSSGLPRGFQSVRSPEGLPFQPPPSWTVACLVYHRACHLFCHRVARVVSSRYGRLKVCLSSHPSLGLRSVVSSVIWSPAWFPIAAFARGFALPATASWFVITPIISSIIGSSAWFPIIAPAIASSVTTAWFAITPTISPA